MAEVQAGAGEGAESVCEVRLLPGTGSSQRIWEAAKLDPKDCGRGPRVHSEALRSPAITHLPSQDCVGPGYSAMEIWHSPLVMWPSLLVVMTQDPLPSAHSLSLRAVFST